MGTRIADWFRTLLRAARSRLCGYPYTVALVLMLGGMTAPFLLRHDTSEWDDVYVRAARHLRSGEKIYAPGEAYVYPPLMALLAVPFTLAPQAAERLAWLLINAACLALVLRWAWRMSGGGKLEGPEPAAAPEHVIWLLGLACAFRYAIDCLSHQQNDLLTAALVFGGCVALTKSRPYLAATGFGLAAAIKCTPLLWTVYLAWKGRGRAAACVLGVAVAASLAPDLLHSPASGGIWLTAWLKSCLTPITARGFYPGVWFSDAVFNQSVSGAAYRWLVTTWSWAGGSVRVAQRAAAPSPLAVKAVVYAVEAGLAIAAAWAVGRGRRHPADQDDERRPAEFSVVLLLMLLFSPMSSKPHFCTMLLPAFCLARRAVCDKNRSAGLFLALAVAAGVAGTKGLWGGNLSVLALWCGNVMWSAVFLCAGCFQVLAVRRPAKSADPVILHLPTPPVRLRRAA
jgi:hypothetical protein